jgi:hypothetical protein
MKLSITHLTDEQRQQLEGNKGELTSLREELDSCVRDLSAFNADLRIAEGRQAELAGKAALDSDAAIQLAGVELQLSRLRPIVKAKTNEFSRLLAGIARRVYIAHKDTVVPIVATPFAQQLQAQYVSAARGFYFDDRRAIQMASHTDSMAVLYGWYRRPEPAIASAEDAINELRLAIEEIDNILEKKPVVDVTAQAPPPRQRTVPKRERQADPEKIANLARSQP